MSNDNPNKTPFILTNEQESWLEITLNRSGSFNALSDGMLDALITCLSATAERDDIHCVINKATGKAFCAGHNLKEMNANVDRGYYAALFNKCSTLMQAIVALPIPVIAEVQGIATVAGFQRAASSNRWAYQSCLST